MLAQEPPPLGITENKQIVTCILFQKVPDNTLKMVEKGDQLIYFLRNANKNLTNKVIFHSF